MGTLCPLHIIPPSVPQPPMQPQHLRPPHLTDRECRAEPRRHRKPELPEDTYDRQGNSHTLPCDRYGSPLLQGPRCKRVVRRPRPSLEDGLIADPGLVSHRHLSSPESTVDVTTALRLYKPPRMLSFQSCVGPAWVAGLQAAWWQEFKSSFGR